MKRTISKGVVKYILFALLVGVMFIHVSKGIEFSDTGYNLANYENFPNVNHTWMISTVLSMTIGKLLTLLPFGHTMLFMNIYCTMIVTVFAGIFYFALSKKFNYLYVFIGMLLAVLATWGPYVILYHYLGYFLFGLGGLLLAKGLSENSLKKIALSAIILSINVFICFPNICEATLGIVIICDMIIERKNRIKEILIFVGSYVSTLLIGVLIVTFVFGKNAYIGMIQGLFAISEANPSYEPLNMIETIFEGYRWDFKYFAMSLIVSLIGVLVYHKANNKVIKVLSVLVCALFSLAVLRLMKYYGRLDFNYSDYYCFCALTVVLILLGVFISIVSLFNKDLEVHERLLASLVPIMVFITPIGSNSGMYTLLNALFLVLPISFGLLSKRANKCLSSAPFAVTVGLFSVAMLFQGILFKYNYVYRDMQQEYVKINKAENVTLAGMRTSPEKKEYIVGLSDYLKSENLEGERVIVFGHIPMTAYAFPVKNAISHVWPSLDSYPLDDFRKELEALGDNPVIVYQSGYGDLLTKDYKDSFSEKEIILCEYAKSRGYKVTYQNDFFTVLRVE